MGSTDRRYTLSLDQKMESRKWGAAFYKQFGNSRNVPIPDMMVENILSVSYREVREFNQRIF